MRYRPLNVGGRSSSAVCLALQPGRKAGEAATLVCRALECGVNTFSLAEDDDASAEALRLALSGLDRRLFIILLRLEAGPEVAERVRACGRRCGCGPFDGVLSREGGEAWLASLQALTRAGLAARLGRIARVEEAPAMLDAGGLDLLMVDYNMGSAGRQRDVIRRATQAGVTVFGHEPHGRLDEGAEPVKPRLWKRRGGRASDPYAFLSGVRGWTAEQLTLAFALAEPDLSGVFVDTANPDALEALCEVVERALPTGLAAQVEMARFGRARVSGAA